MMVWPGRRVRARPRRVLGPVSVAGRAWWAPRAGVRAMAWTAVQRQRESREQPFPESPLQPAAGVSTSGGWVGFKAHK